ncbi:putative Ribose-phosphate pyrophosphokinase [Blattamonas nauphoetae]|uniref:ribose-phosphate diphosphokinase n=1 Tax=Blattamonas nauphoetae TaxID=2049346 RepID=A0ABQ9XLQ2_9EUKA|nr:putative Ribose-phosphate pyrophosphokinase [Blattamonas nauphoetae]
MAETEQRNQVLILCNTKSDYFSKLLLNSIRHILPESSMLEVTRKAFPDGERYYRIEVDNQLALFGKDCIFVASLLDDDDYMEFYRIAYTLDQLGARSRIFVIPYLGCAWLNEDLQHGEVSYLKANAQLFSAITTSGFGNSFLFMDLHHVQFLHYLEGSTLHVELQSYAALSQAMEENGFFSSDFMFASADLGRVKTIDLWSKKYKTDVAFVRKEPDPVDGTTRTSVIGQVKNKNVIIYDDMIRSGRTILAATHALLEEGALSVRVVASHLCCSEKTIQQLIASPITHIICTNSHPTTQSPLINDRFTIVDVTPLFSYAVNQILRPNISPTLDEMQPFFEIERAMSAFSYRTPSPAAGTFYAPQASRVPATESVPFQVGLQQYTPTQQRTTGHD